LLALDVGAKGAALAGKDLRMKDQTIDHEANAVSNNLAEADHRIANHLTMPSGYVRLKAGRLVEQEALPNAEDVRCLNRLIDALIQQVDGLIEYLSTSQGLTVRVELPVAMQTALPRTAARSTHSSLSKTNA